MSVFAYDAWKQVGIDGNNGAVNQWSTPLPTFVSIGSTIGYFLSIVVGVVVIGMIVSLLMGAAIGE